jgi:hypothetical protein
MRCFSAYCKNLKKKNTTFVRDFGPVLVKGIPLCNHHLYRTEVFGFEKNVLSKMKCCPFQLFLGDYIFYQLE